MSRSVVVMLVAGAILLAVLGVGLHHAWPALAVEGTGVKALLIGLGVYGALLAAVMIRRIAEPRLDMPILAWLIAGAWMIFAAFNKTPEEKRREEERARMHEPEPEESSSFGKDGTGLAWAIALTVAGLGMYAAGLGGAHWLASKHVAKPAEPVKPVPAPHPSPAPRPAPSKPAPPRDILELGNFLEALAYAAPKLSDDAEPGEGSKQLARWLAKKGVYSELAVANNQTSLELVEKDPAKQRGNKLCVAGKLERIEKQSLDGIEIHAARLVTPAQDVLELYAVGRTGSLVKRQSAKFCGVITGALREGRATVSFAVGMFDTNK